MTPKIFSHHLVMIMTPGPLPSWWPPSFLHLSGASPRSLRPVVPVRISCRPWCLRCFSGAFLWRFRCCSVSSAMRSRCSSVASPVRFRCFSDASQVLLWCAPGVTRWRSRCVLGAFPCCSRCSSPPSRSVCSVLHGQDGRIPTGVNRDTRPPYPIHRA